MKNKYHWYRFTFTAKGLVVGVINWKFIKKDHITSSELKRIEAGIEKANSLKDLFITSKMYMGYMSEAEFNFNE